MSPYYLQYMFLMIQTMMILLNGAGSAFYII